MIHSYIHVTTTAVAILAFFLSSALIIITITDSSSATRAETDGMISYCPKTPSIQIVPTWGSKVHGW